MELAFICVRLLFLLILCLCVRGFCLIEGHLDLWDGGKWK